MSLVRQSLLILCVMFSFSIGAIAQQTAEPRSAREGSLALIGWRLPSKIVLRGNFVGADRLHEIAGDIELQTDAKMELEGDPTPLMQAVVSALADLHSGYIEIRDGKITVIGIAEPNKIAELKSRIENQASQNMKIAKLQIGAPDQAPFEWAASRYTDDYGSDTIELSGFVIDESARAKIIGIARSVSDDLIVIDKMKVKSALPSRVNDAAVAGLAQLDLLNDGFVWVYENRVDLFGSSWEISVSNDKLGCRVLSKVMPRGIKCGIVGIVQQQRHRHRYHRGWGGGYHGHSHGRDLEESYFSKTKPFVAVDPNKFAGTSLINKSSDPRVVDILFATLRKLENGNSPAAPIFSGERSQSLNFGRARVRIPEDHKIGRLELPGGLSIFGIQLTHEEADPKKHFILRSRQPLTLEQWDSLIDTIGPNDAVVFVHGFNTSFDDFVFRFAQIVWDLQYKGLPVLFSWASKGAVVDYPYDRESALVARDAFMELLANLSEKHKISTVHVIAHSMGNFLVLDALARQATQPNNVMGQLIMAAPDVDRDQFVQDIPKIKQLFRGLTLYASSADKALAASKIVAGGIPRAGDVPINGPIVLPGLETLDVSALGEEMFGLNHTTFAQARPLIDDIQLILSEGRHAPRLAQERPMPENASVPKYWRFAP